MIVEDKKCCTCGKETTSLYLIPTWDFRVLFDEKAITKKTLACNRCFIECQMVSEIYSKEDINNYGKKPTLCFVCNKESLYLFSVRQNNKSGDNFITKIQYCHGLVINNEIVKVCHRCLYLMDMWYNLKERYEQLTRKSLKRKQVESPNNRSHPNKREKIEDKNDKLSKIQKLLQMDINNADSFYKPSRLKSRRDSMTGESISTIDLTLTEDELFSNLKPASSVLNRSRVSRKIRMDEKLYSQICYVNLSNSPIKTSSYTLKKKQAPSAPPKNKQAPSSPPKNKNTKSKSPVRKIVMQTRSRGPVKQTEKYIKSQQTTKRALNKSTSRNNFSTSKPKRKKTRTQSFLDYEENSNYQITTIDEVITLDEEYIVSGGNTRRNSDANSDRTDFDITESSFDKSQQKVVMVLLHNVDDIAKNNSTTTSITRHEESDPLSPGNNSANEQFETASDKTEFELDIAPISSSNESRIDTSQKEKTDDVSEVVANEITCAEKIDVGRENLVNTTPNKEVDNSMNTVVDNEEEPAFTTNGEKSVSTINCADEVDRQTSDHNQEISIDKEASTTEDVTESVDNVNNSTSQEDAVVPSNIAESTEKTNELTNESAVNESSDTPQNLNNISSSETEDENKVDSSMDNNVIVVVHSTINSSAERESTNVVSSHSDNDCTVNNDTTNIDIISVSVEVETSVNETEQSNLVDQNSSNSENSIMTESNIDVVNDKNIDDKYTKVAQKLAELDA